MQGQVAPRDREIEILLFFALGREAPFWEIDVVLISAKPTRMSARACRSTRGVLLVTKGVRPAAAGTHAKCSRT